MYDEKKSFMERAEQFLGGKGFYIVLSVCVVIIGLSAWFIFKSLTAAEEDYEPNTAVSVDSGKKVIDVITKDQEDSSTAEVPDADAENTEKPEEPNIESLGETESVTPQEEPEAEDTMAEVTEEINTTPTYVWPVNGDTGNGYTGAELVFSKTMSDWRVHRGIDIECAMGTKVLAAAAGTVESVENDELYGTTVVIDHGNGKKSIYANLAETPTVEAGEWVNAGDVIGAVGDSADIEIGEAAHLHFEMMSDGEQIDPFDVLP